MDFQVRESDLAAFVIYASRERSLDAALRVAEKQGRFQEHRKSVAKLRELNYEMLMSETPSSQDQA